MKNFISMIIMVVCFGPLMAKAQDQGNIADSLNQLRGKFRTLLMKNASRAIEKLTSEVPRKLERNHSFTLQLGLENDVTGIGIPVDFAISKLLIGIDRKLQKVNGQYLMIDRLSLGHKLGASFIGKVGYTLIDHLEVIYPLKEKDLDTEIKQFYPLDIVDSFSKGEKNLPERSVVVVNRQVIKGGGLATPGLIIPAGAQTGIDKFDLSRLVFTKRQNNIELFVDNSTYRSSGFRIGLDLQIISRSFIQSYLPIGDLERTFFSIPMKDQNNELFDQFITEQNIELVKPFQQSKKSSSSFVKRFKSLNFGLVKKKIKERAEEILFVNEQGREEKYVKGSEELQERRFYFKKNRELGSVSVNIFAKMMGSSLNETQTTIALGYADKNTLEREIKGYLGFSRPLGLDKTSLEQWVAEEEKPSFYNVKLSLGQKGMERVFNISDEDLIGQLALRDGVEKEELLQKYRQFVQVINDPSFLSMREPYYVSAEFKEIKYFLEQISLARNIKEGKDKMYYYANALRKIIDIKGNGFESIVLELILPLMGPTDFVIEGKLVVGDKEESFSRGQANLGLQNNAFIFDMDRSERLYQLYYKGE